VEGFLLAVFSKNTQFACLQAAQERQILGSLSGRCRRTRLQRWSAQERTLLGPDPQLTRPVQPGEAVCSIDLEICWSLPVINISLAPFCLSALLENRSFRPLIGPSINIQEIRANK